MLSTSTEEGRVTLYEKDVMSTVRDLLFLSRLLDPMTPEKTYRPSDKPF